MITHSHSLPSVRTILSAACVLTVSLSASTSYSSYIPKEPLREKHPLATKSLPQDIVLLKENPDGTTESSLKVPASTEVTILQSNPTASLISYQNHSRWVDNPWLNGKPSRKTKEKIQPSKLNSDLIIEALTPFEITGRISSLRHYTPEEKSAHPVNSISPADFSLVWGPYDSPLFTSHQGNRYAMASYPPEWPQKIGPVSQYWRNFHLLSDSKAITQKLLACQTKSLVTLKGNLSLVKTKEGQTLWKSSEAMGYCLILLVEEVIVH
jgi:hypothetical protein